MGSISASVICESNWSIPIAACIASVFAAVCWSDAG